MSDSRRARTAVVANTQGLHARPADLFAKLASQFESKIEIVKGATRVNGKSVLQILMLGAVQGTELSIEADGRDADAALDALAELIASGFDENGETGRE